MHDHNHDRGFDQRAATWDDDPSHIERAAAVAAAIAAAVPLDSTTRWFEYGAGTGLVTEQLVTRLGGERPGTVVLADTSQGMRDVMAAKVAAGALPDASVWAVDLAADDVPDAEFDVVAISMTLHHITEYRRVLGAFAALLRPGGHLCIADLEAEDGSFHGEGFDGHHGFVRSELATALGDAGFADVVFGDCHHVVRHDRRYGVFLVTCRRR